jgi:hypothetical protein
MYFFAIIRHRFGVVYYLEELLVKVAVAEY